MENVTKQRSVGKKGQIGRMPFLMEIWVTPTLHPLSPLENLETNCSAFPQHLQKIAFVLSVSLEEFQFLITYLPQLHLHP